MALRSLRAGAAILCLTALVGAAEPASATFVHQVGRMWMIGEWVRKTFDGRVVELTPITYRGNPAFRVSFVPGDGSGHPGSGLRTFIIDAGSMAPVEELKDYVPPVPSG